MGLSAYDALQAHAAGDASYSSARTWFPLCMSRQDSRFHNYVLYVGSSRAGSGDDDRGLPSVSAAETWTLAQPRFFMLRDFNILPRWSCLALGIVVFHLQESTGQAQILLRPQPDAVSAGPAYRDGGPEGSQRQKPVSRGGLPGLLPQRFEESAAASGSNREQEYQQLLQEANALERQLGLIRRIVKFASPSIVHIEATKKMDPGKGFASSRVEEAGAGVVISLGGLPHVLTNRHVIYPADIHSIRLELNDGRQLRALEVWTDPSTDVAVIRVEGSDLTHAKLGDSDAMEIGDFVLAVGSPFGLSHSVTYGILSAKGRRNLELGSKEIEIQDFFQTDAAINPGNSGGPLLNLRGEIVGINTAIASNSGGNEGIGFSIPINMAIVVADQLVSRGRLQRSYLGVQLENSFDIRTARRLGLSSNMGALVKSIIPDSPAARAGVRVGDVIVEFDGLRIQNDGHLVSTVGLTPVGRSVPIVIYRNGTASRLSALLEASPES
ncbi:MAG: trypsin-like peptidase domain-containing protein [Planctomycetales bacterium]|nr:trypsin-like peptidase domain-containing protein [Planctomycetales bacterium]